MYNYKCSMSVLYCTNIWLRRDHMAKIKAISQQSGVAMSELVRRAIEKSLVEGTPMPDELKRVDVPHPEHLDPQEPAAEAAVPVNAEAAPAVVEASEAGDEHVVKKAVITGYCRKVSSLKTLQARRHEQLTELESRLETDNGSLDYGSIADLVASFRREIEAKDAQLAALEQGSNPETQRKDLQSGAN